MEPGSTLGNGRYVLTELVGAGGVGEVWRATDTVLERTVAVKVLKSTLVEEFGAVRRFAAEARVMARLDHRGIAAVYDFGHDADDVAYLVMRFVDGEPLRRIMDRLGSISPERTLTLLIQAADALDAAHEAGVIHRDVKPGNLLVRADGSVVLTDFGIARAAGGADLTGAGMVVGTARYIAPEQASASEITSAVDLYALGVTAYECLTGHVPFDGDSPIDIARQHVESPVPPLPVELPATVRGLVNQMLAKRPPMRPTAAEVASAARAALASLQTQRTEAVLAGPVRRRRALALVATGLVAGLIAVSLIAFGPNGSGVDPASGLSVGVNSGLGGGASPAPTHPAVTGTSTIPVVAPTTPGTQMMPPAPTGRSQTSPGRQPTRTPGGVGTTTGNPAPTTTPPTTTPPPPPTSEPPPTLYPVPDVFHADEYQAVRDLETAGFMASIQREFRDGLNCDLVVDQSPAAGSMQLPQTVVTITIESCPPPP